MDISDYLGMIRHEYFKAQDKHPEFVDVMSIWNAERLSWRLKGMRMQLSLPATTTLKDFEDILKCEMLEALEAYAQGNYKHAMEEFAQCGAFCARAMARCAQKIEELKAKGASNE